MSNAITQAPRNQLATVKQWIEAPNFKEQIARALPKHMTADRFTRIAITATLKTPKLLECTQASILNCLLQLSQYGLEPDGRRAHLIPYGKECTLIIDYKGLAELVYRSGLVAIVHADIVCENDEFAYDLGEVTTHKPQFKGPRGKVYAVYAYVKFKDGSRKADVMTIDEVEAVRARSRSGRNGPWVTDWNEMAKKTVFRRLTKWLPLSPEIRDAVQHEDEQEERIRDLGQADTISVNQTTSDALADMLTQSSEALDTEPDTAPEGVEIDFADWESRLAMCGSLNAVEAMRAEVDSLPAEHREAATKALAAAKTEIRKRNSRDGQLITE